MLLMSKICWIILMVTMTLSLLLTVLTNPVVLMKKKRSEKNLLCKLDILSVHEKILFCRHCQKNIPREAAFRGLFFWQCLQNKILFNMHCYFNHIFMRNTVSSISRLQQYWELNNNFVISNNNSNFNDLITYCVPELDTKSVINKMVIRRNSYWFRW